MQLLLTSTSLSILIRPRHWPSAPPPSTGPTPIQSNNTYNHQQPSSQGWQLQYTDLRIPPRYPRSRRRAGCLSDPGLQVHHILLQEYIIFDALETKHSDPAAPFVRGRDELSKRHISHRLCVPTKSTVSSTIAPITLTGSLYSAALVILISAICENNFVVSTQLGQILQAVSEAVFVKRILHPLRQPTLLDWKQQLC